MALSPSVFGPDLLGGQNQATTLLAGIGLIPPQWGIFNAQGGSAVTADNVMGFSYKQEWTIADYPLEAGAFESYDKVQTPFSARVQFSSGASLSNRQKLINSVAKIAGDLNIYSVVTPTKTYPSVNVMHYDYDVKEGNAGRLLIDVWLLEIRINTSSTLSNTQQPSGADTSNGGQVQTTAPSAAQTAAVNSAQTNAAIAAGA